MKCPNCGQWNRASLPRCMKCGTPLEASGDLPDWKRTLKDGQTPTSYIRLDQDGLSEDEPDARDTLANEMQDFKLRKEEGVQRKRRLRSEMQARADEPASTTVRLHRSQATFQKVGYEADADPAEPKRMDPDRGYGSQLNVNRVRVVNRPENAYRAGAVSPSGNVVYLDNSRNSDPLWREAEIYGTRFQAPDREDLTGILPARTRRLKTFLKIMLILLIIALVLAAGFFGYSYFKNRMDEEKEKNQAQVVASIYNDLAAHTIMIPGTDGQQIYIRELHTSYVVSGGFATVEVADHTWYDALEDFLDESMEVNLTPFVKTASGQQRPLDVISYSIEIPESPIEMLSPDAHRVVVASTMYAMRFKVRPGSRVYVNDTDVSDTVNSETGEFSYNATVQPVGDNVFTIRVRSQYCRESSMEVILYRERQEIPLDLAADTYTSYTLEYMTIKCSTLPGATIQIESPFTQVDITNLASSGSFSFEAHFDHIGYNTVKIRASFPGRKDSVIEYQVYYVPSADVYTPKAWPLTAEGYSELISNISVRAARTQVYVVTGHLAYFVSQKPQMAVFYTSEDEKSQPVMVENYSSRNWEKGVYYRIYADAYSTYNAMPWLCARYTYPN